jgi:hypothetical protein
MAKSFGFKDELPAETRILRTQDKSIGGVRVRDRVYLAAAWLASWLAG